MKMFTTNHTRYSRSHTNQLQVALQHLTSAADCYHVHDNAAIPLLMVAVGPFHPYLFLIQIHHKSDQYTIILIVKGKWSLFEISYTSLWQQISILPIVNLLEAVEIYQRHRKLHYPCTIGSSCIVISLSIAVVLICLPKKWK